jgi:hypothetical protein
MTTHTSEHMKEIFRGYLGSYYSDCEKPDLLGMTIEQVIGKLWNCTDILPAEACVLLDIRRGSTYAIGVRKFKQEIAN